MTQKTIRKRLKHSLNQDDWLSAGREILIEKGINALTLRGLSEKLSVTTGAFYWQFKKLNDFHDAIRLDWINRNTTPFTRVFESNNLSAQERYIAYVNVLILEQQFDPHYDNAIREWSHSSKKTAEVLFEVDRIRIEQLTRMFEEFGYDERTALIRARVTYFHQSGYISMGIVQTIEQRLCNVSHYAIVLTGHDVFKGETSPDKVRAVLDNVAKKV